MAAAALILSTQWSQEWQDVTQLDNLLADHQSGYTPVNFKGKARDKAEDYLIILKMLFYESERFSDHTILKQRSRVARVWLARNRTF